MKNMKIPAGWLTLCLAIAAAGCEKSPAAPDDADIVYTAIGASDANGIGSTRICFGSCTDGQGYVPQLTRRLQQTGATVTQDNLGIATAVLSPEFQQLANSVNRQVLGNFLQNELPAVRADTTLVTIFAGGNDANIVGKAIQDGQAGGDINGYINARVQAFGRDLRTLVSGIRARASNARIVFLNLPNLAAMPYSAGLTLNEKRVLQQIAVGFSAQVNSLVADGVLVADLMCDPRSIQPSIFSEDGFHPNDSGYTFLTDLLFGPASTGSAAPPLSSCGNMTLF